jgi:hypothetical protein
VTARSFKLTLIAWGATEKGIAIYNANDDNLQQKLLFFRAKLLLKG